MFKNFNNYIMLAIIFFALYLSGYFAHAQTYVEKQNAAHINLLENAGFESNLAKWSKVGSLGTLTTTNSTTALLQGKYSAQLAFGSSTQSAAACSNYYDPQSLKNSNGEMGFSYRFSSVNPASGTVFVEDASGTVLSKMDLDITLLGEKRDASKLFAFNDKLVRLCMLGKGTSAIPWGIILDNTWLGSPRNVTQGSDTATLIGRLRYSATANCSWNTSSTSFANYAADVDCPTPTVFGRAAAPATKIPAIVFNTLPAGKYRVVATGMYVQQSTNTSQGRFIDSIGNVTNSIHLSTNGVGAWGTYSNSIEGVFEYNGAQSNVTIQLQGKVGAGSVSVDAVGNDFEIAVYRYPTESLTMFSGMCKDAYECENTFVAKVSAAGVITKPNVAGWLSGCSLATSTFTCNFKTNLFLDDPVCSVLVRSNPPVGGSNSVVMGSPTLTSGTISVSMSSFGVGNVPYAYEITCTRSTDHVQKKVIQGYLSEQNLLVSYYASANKNTSTTLPLDFDTKLIDATNCNCVTTGSSWKFTAPRAGYYEISVNHILETTGGAYYFIYKNGVIYAPIAYSQNAAATFGVGKRSIYLAAADYIDVRADSSKTVNGGSLTTSAPRAFIEVKWLGN